jgi:hypothetical protein
MRAGPPDEVLAGQPIYGCRVSSWLGSLLLAATVPVVSGRATGKADSEVLEEVKLTVPRWAAATPGGGLYDWRPGSSTSHPLARYGQQLDVTSLVTSVITGQVWETRIGRYKITDWDDDDAGTVSISAESVIGRIRDDKLQAASSPSGTYKSEVRRLLPAGVGVSFDPALIDRDCPTSMAWSRNRLDALQEIADAWPALLRVDPWGQVVFKAPLPSLPTPVLTLSDGNRGTLVRAPRADSRKDAYNVVIASTSNTSDADFAGIAAITSGPMSINGEYGVVTKEWSSSLLRTQAEADAAAAADLAQSNRAAQTIPVTMAPDPRIELDDPVAIQRGTDAPVWGWVTAWDLPLTALDGDGRIDVGVPA